MRLMNVVPSFAATMLILASVGFTPPEDRLAPEMRDLSAAERAYVPGFVQGSRLRLPGESPRIVLLLGPEGSCGTSELRARLARARLRQSVLVLTTDSATPSLKGKDGVRWLADAERRWLPRTVYAYTPSAARLDPSGRVIASAVGTPGVEQLLAEVTGG